MMILSANNRITVLRTGGYEYDGVPTRRVSEVLDVLAAREYNQLKRAASKAVVQARAHELVEMFFRGEVTDPTLIACMINDDTNAVARQVERDFAAADSGTRIHAYMAYRLLGEKEPALKVWATLTTLEQLKATQIWSWIEYVDFDPIAVEYSIHDSTYNVTGTVDAIGTLNYKGQRITGVPDWKTGMALHEHNEIQAMGYMDIIARDENIPTAGMAFLVRPYGDNPKRPTGTEEDPIDVPCEVRVISLENVKLWKKWRACLELAS